MKKIIYLFCCCCFYCNLFAQQNIKGKVLNQQNEKIDYFNVQLFIDTVDWSNPAVHGYFIDGFFTLNAPNSDSIIIEISSLGFETAKFKISSNQINNEDFIFHLKNKSFEIDAVTVSGTKPRIIKGKNGYVLNVQNSSLSNESTISKVIAKMPFILFDANNKISIAGKDKVVIYLNGRKINYQEELDVISPSNIAEIELITEPGAKYEADADAVVLIKTKKNKTDGLTLSLKGNAQQANRLTYKMNPTLMYKYKKINIYLDYNYTSFSEKCQENSFIHNLKTKSHNKIYINSDNTTGIHTYICGLNYEINEKNNILFQYLGWQRNPLYRKQISNLYEINNLENLSTETNKRAKNPQNHSDFCLNYNFKPGINHQIMSSINYVNHQIKTNENIWETILKYNSTTNEICKYNHQNDNQIANFKTTYDWNISKIQLNLSTGINLSYFANKSNGIFYRDTLIKKFSRTNTTLRRSYPVFI